MYAADPTHNAGTRPSAGAAGIGSAPFSWLARAGSSWGRTARAAQAAQRRCEGPDFRFRVAPTATAQSAERAECSQADGPAAANSVPAMLSSLVFPGGLHLRLGLRPAACFRASHYCTGVRTSSRQRSRASRAARPSHTPTLTLTPTTAQWTDTDAMGELARALGVRFLCFFARFARSAGRVLSPPQRQTKAVARP